MRRWVLGGFPLLLAMASAPSDPPAFVQIADYGTFQGPSDFSVLFPNPVSGGNLIVVALGHSATASLQISDALGDVYTRAAGPRDGAGTLAPYAAEIWWARVADGGSPALGVHYHVDGDYQLMVVHQLEYSGLQTVAPIDTGSFASSTTTNEMDGGTLMTRYPRELIFSWDATASQDQFTQAGPNFSARTHPGTQLIQDRVCEAPGPYPITASSNNSTWVMQSLAFIPSNLPDGGILESDGGMSADDGGTPPMVDAGNPNDGGKVDGGVLPPDAGEAPKLAANLGCGCAEGSAPLGMMGSLLLAAWLRRRSRS